MTSGLKLSAILATLFVLAACQPKTTEVNREMRLVFHFINADPADSGYTVLLSARDAATLGSATESTPRPDDPVNPDDPVHKFFVASNFIDRYDGDDLRPDPPCFQDAVMLREPSGEVSELFRPGHCLDRSWNEDNWSVNDPSPQANRKMELSFNLVPVDRNESGYTVLLSERDAATLGSTTEALSYFGVPRSNYFLATNVIDEYDDDVKPEPPCLQDAITLRTPSDEIVEMFEPGYCLSVSWTEVIYSLPNLPPTSPTTP